jgi:TonB family protein
MEKLILECVVRSALIAVCTAAALYIFRVKAARVRHAVWASVVVLMLLLPSWTVWGPKAVLRVMKPEPAPVYVRPAVETVQQDVIAPPLRQKADWNIGNYLVAVYLVGLFALLVRLAIGTMRARRLIRGALLIKDGDRQGRLTNDSCVAPITVGWLNPAVILPARWPEWSLSQLNAVLTHEDEHARRRDPLVQWLALLNRAVFWFHPLAWWLSRRLSALAEEACDDAVLAHGHDPLQYSECLLDLARSVRQASVRVNVVGMAMPGAFLPQRIRRIAAGTPVQRVSRGRMVCVAVVCAAVSMVFTSGAVGYSAPDNQTDAPEATSAIAQDVPAPSGEATVSMPAAAPPSPSPAPPATMHWAPSWQGQRAKVIRGFVNGVLVAQQTIPAKPTDEFGAAFQTFKGVVMDPTNAVVANAAVTLTNTDTGASISTTTDATGTYRFPNVDPGNYKVMLRVPGFKAETQTGIHVAAGEAHNGGTMYLQIGSISESISVTGSRSAPVPAVLPTVGNVLGPVTTLGPMTTLAPPTGSPAGNNFRFTIGRTSPPDQAAPGGLIRVGGMVQASRLVSQIKPVYPTDLQQQGVEGTVKIQAVLTKEGVLSGIQVISVNMDPRLTQPALDAVKQWRYQPTLLNGEPVEVVTMIDVNFSLGN